MLPGWFELITGRYLYMQAVFDSKARKSVRNVAVPTNGGHIHPRPSWSGPGVEWIY